MRTLAISLILLVTFGLSACGSTEPAPPAPPKEGSINVNAPANVDGVWKADGFEAIIGDKIITIYLVDGSSKSLYWKGSFRSTAILIDKVITSAADVEALEQSILGSQSKTKDFYYQTGKDEISFTFNALGVSTNVVLSR